VVSEGSSDFSALGSLEECLHIKNSSGVLVYVNDAHRRLFTPDASPIGRTVDAFLEPNLSAMVQKLDELVQGGCSFIECEHTGQGPDGTLYQMHSLKCSLSALGTPGIAL
ncbi:unnamed protein product, partial [Ectocarpus sp. 4 AP-2014]